MRIVAPGLMAATVLQNATGESLWPVLSGFKWMRFYEGMAASPMSPDDVYVGNLMWIALRFSVTATAFLIVAALLGAILSWWGVLAIPAAVLGAIALAAPLIAWVATQEDDHGFGVIMRFLTLPMFLFSGTFFPITLYPTWLEYVVRATPLYQGVALARGCSLGMFNWAMVGHVAYLSVMSLVGLVITSRRFRGLLTP